MNGFAMSRGLTRIVLQMKMNLLLQMYDILDAC